MSFRSIRRVCLFARVDEVYSAKANFYASCESKNEIAVLDKIGLSYFSSCDSVERKG